MSEVKEGELVQAKEVAQSPLPVTTKAEQYDFFDALKQLQAGKKITRQMWPDGEYGLLKDGLVQLYKDNKFFTWLISDGDMEGTDWIILNDK